jgi:hypothetical protein
LANFPSCDRRSSPERHCLRGTDLTAAAHGMGLVRIDDRMGSACSRGQRLDGPLWSVTQRLSLLSLGVQGDGRSAEIRGSVRNTIYRTKRDTRDVIAELEPKVSNPEAIGEDL